MIEGHTARLVVTDGAGNEVETMIEFIADVKDVRTVISRPKAGETIRNGKLGINFSILTSGSLKLYYTVEHNGTEIHRAEIAENKLKAMKEKDLEETRALFDDLMGDYEGYTIRESVTLKNMPVGQHVLSIYTDDLGDTPTLLAQQTFANGETEAIAGVDSGNSEENAVVHESQVVTDTYAFGLDPLATDTFAPSQVYFTGWCWSERNDGLFFDVIIDGKRYTQQDLEAAGGKVTASRSRRAVSKEFPGLVSGVTPTDRYGGVVILLDMSFLKEGKHDVQIVLIKDSKEQQFASRSIKTSADVETQRNLVKNLQGQWN